MDLTDIYIYSSKYKDMVIQISNQLIKLRTYGCNVINLENLEKNNSLNIHVYVTVSHIYIYRYR